MTAVRDKVETDEYDAISSIALQWKIGDPINVRRCTPKSQNFLFDTRQNDQESTYMVNLAKGEIRHVDTHLIPKPKPSRIGEVHHKWEPAELDFLKLNINHTTRWLADRLPFHTYSSTMIKRQQLLGEMSKEKKPKHTEIVDKLTADGFKFHLGTNGQATINGRFDIWTTTGSWFDRWSRQRGRGYTTFKEHIEQTLSAQERKEVKS